MNKINCWEYKKCGREPEGVNVLEFGVCPVTTNKKLDGVHGGKNSGRSCWVVARSMCHGNIQGAFEQKFENCILCDFYKLVKEEEGGLTLASELIIRLYK